MAKVVARCSCGKLKSDATFVVLRERGKRFNFYRCSCGVEWTIEEADIDHQDPVTAEEVITVHERLATFEGSLTELLGE